MKANKYTDHMSCLTFHSSIQYEYEMNNVSIRSRNESTKPSSF